MGFSLTGKDTLVLDGRVIHDFAHGQFAHVAFENPLLNMSISKDGNALLTQQLDGQRVRLTVLLQAGSLDDQIFNSKLKSWLDDAASFQLMDGSFTKRVGDGKGNVKDVIYQLAAGAFSKIPEASSSSTGDTATAIATYEMLFVLQTRAIQ